LANLYKIYQTCPKHKKLREIEEYKQIDLSDTLAIFYEFLNFFDKYDRETIQFLNDPNMICQIRRSSFNKITDFYEILYMEIQNQLQESEKTKLGLIPRVPIEIRNLLLTDLEG